MVRAASAALLGLAMAGCPEEDNDGDETGVDTLGSSTAYGAEESETFEDMSGFLPTSTTAQDGTSSSTGGTSTGPGSSSSGSGSSGSSSGSDSSSGSSSSSSG